MSDRVARRAAQLAALGLQDTRGQRFASALEGAKKPSFADLAAVPRWLMLPPEGQAKVAVVAALIEHRTALANELSGSKLAAIADMVGEDILDAVFAIEADSDDCINSALPRPDQIEAAGWDILHRGLPLALSHRFPAAANDASSRLRAETAFDLAGVA